jgi:predicted nucleic acid-binding protein
MPGKTYIDSGVLIAAFKAVEPCSERAMAIIADESRTFVVSDVLALECIAPARREGPAEQVEFCEEFFSRQENHALDADVTKWAVEIMSRHCIGPIDLLHMAVAVQAGASEFITTEKPTKPFFTIGAPLLVTSLG